MSIYGHCPAHDDFFLVVCSHCGQVVKPQVFQKHCERRHGLFSELYDTSSNCSPDRPQQWRPPSDHGCLCEVQNSRHQGAGPPPHSPHQGHYKPQREGTRWGGVKCSLTWSYPSTRAVKLAEKLNSNSYLGIFWLIDIRYISQYFVFRLNK